MRNAADAFIKPDSAHLPIALQVLRAHDWPVFKRIELHLLRQDADHALDQITNMAPLLAELDAPTKHEAALLLKATFGKLPPTAQEQILRQIDKGPAETGVRRWFTFIQVEPTPEKLADFGNNWRAERLTLIADQVPPAWEERVRSILASTGEVRRADEVNRGITWMGPTSPKTAEELPAKGPEQVLGFLRDWQPKPGHWESTPEGLGRILQGLIATDPAGYVARADEFRAVDPTFVRLFFSGLEGARKVRRAFRGCRSWNLPAGWLSNQHCFPAARKRSWRLIRTGDGRAAPSQTSWRPVCRRARPRSVLRIAHSYLLLERGAPVDATGRCRF